MKRNYLSPHRDSVVRLDEGPEQKERAQIFGFVLAGESRLSRETLVRMFSKLSAGLDASVVPNLLVTLDGHAVRWGQVAKGERKEVRKSAAGTHGVDGAQGRPGGVAGLVVRGDGDARRRIRTARPVSDVGALDQAGRGARQNERRKVV